MNVCSCELIQPLKCRYHYNVTDSRLYQHVEKAKEDGLHISSVASSSNLWAVVMDAGTGFTSQVYEISPVFLHKVIAYFCFAMRSFLNYASHLLPISSS